MRTAHVSRLPTKITTEDRAKQTPHSFTAKIKQNSLCPHVWTVQEQQHQQQCPMLKMLLLHGRPLCLVSPRCVSHSYWLLLLLVVADSLHRYLACYISGRWRGHIGESLVSLIGWRVSRSSAPWNIPEVSIKTKQAKQVKDVSKKGWWSKLSPIFGSQPACSA